MRDGNDRGKNLRDGALASAPKNTMKTGKLKFLGFLTISIIFLLTGRIVYIQAVYGDEFTRRAIVQQVTDSSGNERVISPNRGTILDRNRNLQALAISTTVYNVFIDPHMILNREPQEREEIYAKINDVLGIAIYELRDMVESNPASRYRVIARRINLVTKEAMANEQARHVYFEADTQRHYPGGTLAASLIGYIRGDSAWGLEHQYNRELTGIAGRELRIIDSNNNAVTETVPQTEGHTIITTIDLLIQQEAQRLVAHYGSAALAANAALIVANPHTGEIIAMAEYPSFDLNDPLNVEGVNSLQHRERILQEPEDVRLSRMFEINRNFSVIDTYEPGSIFKPLVFAAALEEGIINEHDIFYCGGGRDVNGTFIRCWIDGNHGHQNYIQALANSCNPAVMDIIARLGRERYYNFQRDFGIGRPTGIDLPGEPNTERLVHGLAMLNPVELAAASMGQGFNVTSMQILGAFSSLINGGNIMQPFVVSQIIDENGEVVFANIPTLNRRVISRETSQRMSHAMIDTIEWGTGIRAGIEGHLIGGKTGTGQQGERGEDAEANDDVVQALITYFPADNPEYIVMSVISFPGINEMGNSQTSPMVRDMMNFIISNRQIEAHDREAFNRVQIDNTVHIDDFSGRGIAEVTRTLNFLGFTYDISGSGDVVRGQFPTGGSRVERGSMVHLTIGMSEPDLALVTVPSVVGLSEPQAVQVIRNAGLVPVVIRNDEEIIADDPDDDSEIIESERLFVVSAQLPDNEIRVAERTEIIIFVE